MIRDVLVHVWVSALVRRAQLAGAFATIVQRGDDERGDVLVKVTSARGQARAYVPAFTPDGPTEFETLNLDGESDDEVAVDAVIRKRCEFDRDLWVVEIEDREGRHFLTEKVRKNGENPAE